MVFTTAQLLPRRSIVRATMVQFILTVFKHHAYNGLFALFFFSFFRHSRTTAHLVAQHESLQMHQQWSFIHCRHSMEHRSGDVGSTRLRNVGLLRDIAEGCNLHTARRENLKSQTVWNTPDEWQACRGPHGTHYKRNENKHLGHCEHLNSIFLMHSYSAIFTSAENATLLMLQKISWHYFRSTSCIPYHISACNLLCTNAFSNVKNNAKIEKHIMASKPITDMMLKMKENISENWTRVARSVSEQVPNWALAGQWWNVL